MPVVLLALDCLLHHLVGNVGGKAREALLRRLVLPEAEQRRDELACGERDEDEREHSREDASQGGGCARDGAAYRLRRCALRCCRRLGAACSLGRLRLDGSLGADGRGACALGRALPLGGPRGARRLLGGRAGALAGSRLPDGTVRLARSAGLCREALGQDGLVADAGGSREFLGVVELVHRRVPDRRLRSDRGAMPAEAPGLRGGLIRNGRSFGGSAGSRASPRCAPRDASCFCGGERACLPCRRGPFRERRERLVVGGFDRPRVEDRLLLGRHELAHPGILVCLALAAHRSGPSSPSASRDPELARLFASKTALRLSSAISSGLVLNRS